MFLIRKNARVLRLFMEKYPQRQTGLFSNFIKTRFYSVAPIYKIDLNLKNVNLNEYILKLEQEYKTCKESNNTSNPRYLELQPIINILNEHKTLTDNIASLKELIESDDKDMAKLATEERDQLYTKLKELEDTLFEALLPIEKEDLCDSIVLEIQAGVGGQEAMLFAQEMYEMYCGFITMKGWDYELAGYINTDIGGLRHASILVNGPQVFRYFKHEGGVHRVQRIPTTEKGGRIHTSTVSVVVLPQPSEIDINIQQKDLKIETKRATGAGGQHVNTTDSAVRIVHLPTNIAVECQVDRSQIKNRKLAMARLRALLYQRELELQTADIQASRKSQVRSSNRNEKIRTYNYNQDRISDHRLQSIHFHNLKVFMQGGADFENMIVELDRQARLDSLLEIVEKTCK